MFDTAVAIGVSMYVVGEVTVWHGADEEANTCV